jgi:polysaccharide export outer membrane protein
MKNNLSHLILMTLVIVGSGLAAHGEDSNLPVDGPALAAAPSAPSAETTPSYRLTPGDLIYVKVFQEDDLSSTLRIGEDGNIIFPLIGTVKVGGMSVNDATHEIYQKLDAKYLVNPQVSLTVLSYSDRHITVLGQVQHPGSYNLKEKGQLDLLEAIGLAGGFTRLANTGHILVRRAGTGGDAQVFSIDANKLAKDSSTPPFQILAGDTITIQERIF